MWQRNNGRTETEIMQNQFTAYLTTAVQRRRNEYLQQIDKRQQSESSIDNFLYMQESGLEQDMFLGLPLLIVGKGIRKERLRHDQCKDAQRL